MNAAGCGGMGSFVGEGRVLGSEPLSFGPTSSTTRRPVSPVAVGIVPTDALRVLADVTPLGAVFRTGGNADFTLLCLGRLELGPDGRQVGDGRG